MEDYFIKNTSGELQAVIKTDLEKLKKVNVMYEALKACKIFIDYHSYDLTEFEVEFKKNIESLLKEIKL